MAGSSFQERVFSTAKRVMGLSRTRLGADLFAALVILRHNTLHIHTMMKAADVTVQNVTAKVEAIIDAEILDDEDIKEAAKAKASCDEVLKMMKRNGGVVWG